MIAGLIEAALRALLVAACVWGGLRLFRVSDVLAQKAAWMLMLAAAAATPALMHRQIATFAAGVRVPLYAWNAAARAAMERAAAVVTAPASPERVGTQFVAILKQPTAPADRVRVPTVSHAEFNPRDQERPAELEAGALPAAAPRLSMAGSMLAQARGMSADRLAEMLYLAVLGCLLVRMLLGLVAAVAIWTKAKPLAAGELDLLDGARGLRVRSSARVSSPVTIGSGVVLPADYADWDVEKLRIVLAHERSHVRQWDFYLQLLAALYAAAFWFSPLGWWLKRTLSDLGEAISDHAGLEQAASRTSYAQVLLEFAAMPRPTATGVAMARTSNLSHRIERLLNESKYRSAFAASGRRVALAALLAPVALFAGTALIRVEAAQAQAAAPQESLAPAAAPAVAPQAAPAEPAAPASPGVVPAATMTGVVAPVPPVTGVVAPLPPVTGVTATTTGQGEIHDAADDRAAAQENEDAKTLQDEAVSASSSASGHSYSTDKYENGKHVYGRSTGDGYTYSYSSNGDSWALITGPKGHVSFSGEWNAGTQDTIDKVRRLTTGKFLWFTRGGKSYFIDDPATLAQIEALYKPMEELSRKQEELGRQEEALGRLQEALGRKQQQASVPTPDVTKEMAKLNEMVAKLEARKGGTVSQEELADLEGKLGDLQGRLGALQGKIGEQQGKLGEQQGALGAQQGKLGAQQGKLGEEQGKIAEQADRQVKSTIDESLKDGKAKPVE